MTIQTIAVQTIVADSYTYQSTDSGSCILRLNGGQPMADTLLILPVNSYLIIKNTDNSGASLILTCGDSALIDGQQNTLSFSGLTRMTLISDGANWWTI